MNISYFDDVRVTNKKIAVALKTLQVYRETINDYVERGVLTVPECSLYYLKDSSLHITLARLEKKYKKIKHLILVGIGGSSLGLEAVHAVLNRGQVELSVLDTVSVERLHEVMTAVKKYKRASDIAICVISKSGHTTETLVNASALLDHLRARFGDAIYTQLICIGDSGTPLMKFANRVKAEIVTMPGSIGGRYSVATAVGLVPMALLRHDVDEFMDGYLDALSSTHESVVAESAARLACYENLGYNHYSFFAFETRLLRLGQWYRQLFAESLGKAKTEAGVGVKRVMVPTIATPVELHSIGQLYLSGVAPVYTDFVTFDDETLDVMLPKRNPIAPNLAGYSLQEVATALYEIGRASCRERV